MTASTEDRKHFKRLSRAGRRSARVRRSASLTAGTVVATGIAVAVGPVRKRLSNALGWSHGNSHHQAATTDASLAERVRDRLQPVTAELQLPPVQVTVSNRVATLHGELHDPTEAGVIEEAAAGTAGIEGVISHLQQRATPDSAPDVTAAEPNQSAALRALLAAARAGGCPPTADYAAVRTVLAIFFEHLPAADQTALVSSLPPDLRRLAVSPRRRGIAISLLANNLDTLTDAVASVVDVPPNTGHDIVVAVLQTLREQLPAEVRGIQAHLPLELADLWSVVPVRPAGLGPDS